MANNAMKSAIELMNSRERFPAVNLVRTDPTLAAVISKMVVSQHQPTYNNVGNREHSQPNAHLFRETSENTARNIDDAETVMQILPDMELCAQILISSILCPKDMVTTELTYTTAEGLLATEVSAAMMARTKEFFERVYKIKPLLSKMLRDILFEKGSYAVAVIPENSIDELINGGQKIGLEALSESINKDGTIKNLGLLGPVIKKKPTASRSVPGLSMEMFDDFKLTDEVNSRVNLELEESFKGIAETFLTVTDNPDLLKIPRIHQAIREQRVQAATNTAMEGISRKLNDREMAGMIYKNRSYSYQPVASVKTQDQLSRNTVGNPLVMHIPSEAIIPVYVPGSVEKQIGFFVLIDAEGHPIAKSSSTDYYQEMRQRMGSSGSFPSAMLAKVKSQMNGFDITNNSHLDYSARVYGDMVDQDLLARLRNGMYGNGVALAQKDEIYRIMLSRALSKQHTQLLFIPIGLMTYFAFKFDSNGIGVSILEGMKILNSLRSMLLFANVMASLKNSIGRTEVKIKLDEDDPDPKKTIEIALSEIIRSRQQTFPLGVNSPTDMVDYLQRASFETTFEGHPGIPDVNIDFGEKSSNYPKPDTELEESLRKRSIMGFGISPATVDASFEAEFATSVLTNNILLSKRVMQIQDQFTPLLSENCQKVMSNSEELVNDLMEILINNFDKLDISEIEREPNANKPSEEEVKKEKTYIAQQILKQFIANFEVSLPRPNSVTLENQMTALETYTKALDACLDAWVSEKFFTTDVGGEVASQVGTIKEILKAYFIRQWLNENGVMPELGHLSTLDENGKPLLDIFKTQEEHIGGLTKSLTDFMVGLDPIKKKSNEELTKLSTDVSGEASGGGEDSGEEGGEDFGLEEPDLGGEDNGNAGPSEQPTGPEEETPEDPGNPEDEEPEGNNETK